MAKHVAAQETPGARQKFHFQFITTPTADTPGTTLLLHFDNQRYIFGRIAEGTQRACIQRGVGIKKVRNLFISGPTSWVNLGGLLGMVLTMADVQYEERDPTTGQRPRLRIQGGPKLLHTIACARRFIFRTGMPIEIHEAKAYSKSPNEPSYVDDNITVWSLPIRRTSRSGRSSPRLSAQRSGSPDTVDREQRLRAETVKNMFDSDWRKDRLVESRFDEVKLPALIWTRDSMTKDLSSVQCVTMADAPHLLPESMVLTRNPWPAALVEVLPPADNVMGSVAVSYIVRGKPQRGKFLPKKAKELGVKPGPDYAVLTSGGSVRLANGTLITSDMVLDKSEPGRGMAILDIPTEDYLEDLSERLSELSGNVLQGVETVSWLLGPGVISSPAFAQAIEPLSGLQHIVCTSDSGSDYFALDSATASAIRLSQIRPECFRIPVCNHDILREQNSPPAFSYVPAERGLIVRVAPSLLINKSEVPPPLDVEEIKASYKSELSDILPQSRDFGPDSSIYDNIEILTLGTGSAVPSKYRNVSATLLRIPGLGSYLFDCGENTLGMLRRSYPAGQVAEILADLRMIWISHLHADHHLGILSVITAKESIMQDLGETGPKLHIVSEPNMADFLNDIDSVQSSAHCTLIGALNSKLTEKSRFSSGEIIEIEDTPLPITEFLTTRVSHCHGAQACSITFENGFKFSYSGDCRPSAQFAKIGENSHVLLHEATFDDGLEGDAKAKKHSTTGEALAVAHAMKAKNVVLTHFSQRYQKIPVLRNVKFSDVQFEEGNDVDEAGPIEDNTRIQVSGDVSVEDSSPENTAIGIEPTLSDSVTALQKVASDMNVCVAFDLMCVKVGQIRDMHRYYPAIEKMFELEQEKSDAKRSERREATEQSRQAKEINNGKDQPAKPVKSTSAKGDIYERINRSKSKGTNEANGSVTAMSSEQVSTDVNTIGCSNNADTIIAPPLSNRARKRLIRKQEAAEQRLVASFPPVAPYADNSQASPGTKEAQKSSRPASLDREERRNKRTKVG